MLELSPPLPVLLLRVGGLSLLNTRAIQWFGFEKEWLKETEKGITSGM
jgi:hypothetical protein